ncbi:hypothetical protein AB1Y20_016673 [Prymnesium parvum]|uniref:TATA-binding protein interacting (TIP20) domain-containing protein n=1 Tax=Prymnesium parvum TaxID=97485 RepID=A0AB34IEE8_PRYPA|eukprot:CAMPEP_0182801940 /NCGR_PEP_ID=MMETSP0006_2-20121128/3217_1 /TAXON_ID=97485 /ORGANISM="Prymnesium parvum, Strain Texoma1" /LENGTH=1232 /DNA_ID=CAMNT_0024927289 /DNA_START=44 /DNA_END=3742 /DNA_ORIENTATION=-
MTSFVLSGILEKTENRDKDFRYMATSDLLAELQKPAFKPDSDNERKICRCILKLLNDQSSDVQGLAVKCLTPLVRKVHDEFVNQLMLELSTSILTGKDEQRDIGAIGLKTVVLEMPPAMGASAVHQLAGKLVRGVLQPVLEIKLECMDILDDLLRRFGASLHEDESHSCMEALFQELGSTRAAARKRAIACIASLSAALSDKLLGQMVTSIVEKMNDDACKLELRRTYIQTLSSISRTGGYRIGKQLDVVMPLVLQHCDRTRGDADAEMLESCLQAFESFVLRCPREVAAFQATISQNALRYLSYDPNYADDDEMEDVDEMEDDEDALDDDDADYSDDDDVSWKVRRAAAKVLSAIIVSRPERLPDLLPEVVPVLVHRLREREENVKMDIFATFCDLLHQVALTFPSQDAAEGKEVTVAAGQSLTGMLMQKVPDIIKAACRQLKDKSLKTRIATFSFMRQLLATLPGCMAEHAAMVVPGVDKALKEESSNHLRIETLLFLQLALSSHPPKVFREYASVLLPSTLSLVNDRYYKIAAEALRVCSEFVRVLRPSPPAVEFDYRPLVPLLFECVERRLFAQDQDQEVKECAILCMELVVCHLGDDAAVHLDRVLPVLLERLRNEITRITAVKAFGAFAAAKLDLSLGAPVPSGGGSVLQTAFTELCSFLRKSSRPLRQASLCALEAMVSSHAALLGDADIACVLNELVALVTDADLHVAHLALQLGASTVRATPQLAVPHVQRSLMPKVLGLLQSSLLQGHALNSLLAFFGELVLQDVRELNFDVVIEQLLSLATDCSRSKHSLAALSQAVGVCCTRVAAAAKRDAMTAQFVAQLRGGASPAQRTLALMCLGEIGRQNDLSKHAALLEAITAEFASEADEVKSAAAFALGNVTAGNLPELVPHMLSKLSDSHEYLMLHALKELIGSGQAQLAMYVDDMVPSLIAFADHEEEGVRNVVSECLGRLTAVSAASVVPKITALLSHESARTRAAMVQSLRFAVAELGGSPLPPLVTASLLAFLKPLSDEDMSVRRAALLGLNCLAHNKPAAVRDILPGLLPMLYEETRKRQDLVHQVDLGPFKHTIDDGLELRKAAFECMDTLLAHCADRLDITEFVVHLVDGLKDDHDIKVLCHMMLGKLAVSTSSALVLAASLDSVVEPLRATICATLKDNAVKQQVERHEDLVRSGMRAVRALEKVPGAETCVKFEEFVRSTLKNGALAERYATVCGEDETRGESA